MRIGQATDIHPLVVGRPLILGGVSIESDRGLEGHSDADALCHAIANAILGALALGDLGRYFPDNEARTEGISSLLIVRETAGMMRRQGYRIGNVDSLILIEEPHMAPYIETMRRNLASALDCSFSLVSVKATRGEKLGFVGKRQGVVAQAVVLLEENHEK